MNPLLASFVPESRDLLQAATAGLLRLEREPGDAAVINEVFRAVHTIKGSSGLFDAAALTRLMHGVEDLLGEVRAGRLAITPDMIDRVLDGLDQVDTWIDALEQHETLPGGADMFARDRLAELRVLMPGRATSPAAESVASVAPDTAWLSLLGAPECDAATRRLADHETVVAIHYVPDEGCFYRGEDPLHLLAQVPDLLALRITPRTAWPPAAELDPYRCNLEFHVLAAAPVDMVAHLFRYVAEQVEIAQLPPDALASGTTQEEPSTLLPRLLAEQRGILGLPAGDEAELHLRLESVIGVLGNLLHGMTPPVPRAEFEAVVAAALDGGGPTPLLALLDRLERPAAAVPGDASTRSASRVLKVDQDRVDGLMNMIGELVVCKNALPFLARRAEQVHGSREMAREIKEQYAIIDRLAQEMQGAIMQVRMIPVSEVFDRFPRLVRDLARKVDKRIELEISGADTAADKTIIDALGDPLLHIVRNAIDHGIEPAPQRRAAGKPANATLRLSASQEGDRVVVEVADDGRGIDPARMRRTAVERQMLDAGQAERLSDQEAVNLIFRAGFSTASEVSDLSGRGVGMDVVRTTVDRLGGHVDVSSVLGEGTRVRLSLPLSMAITHVMIVEAGGVLFGIPMDLIGETVRLDPARVRAIKQARTFVLRQEVVPLRNLAELLGQPAKPCAPDAFQAVLVVRVGGAPVGLVVDRFREGMEVILKPLDGVLASLRGYSGTALLGDGSVLLVLNLKELL